MNNSQENTKRIAQNTLFLYFRTLLTMAIGLYTSRVVLSVLGVEDFGTFGVVAGFVAVFSTVAGALPSAVMRFLTYELGKNNFERLKKIFSTSVNLHAYLALMVFVVTEAAGVWWLNNRMVIPEGRMMAANIVFQISLLNYLVGLMSTPYIAAITAHEHFKTFAYIGLLDAIFKLLSVFLLLRLPTLLHIDKLVLYSALMFVFALIVATIYNTYCRKHFAETKYSYVNDKGLIKEIIGLVGWNFFGSTSQALGRHGVNLVLNLFFGPVLNAARDVAMKTNAMISTFMYNFMTAMNPQITKSYAAGDLKYMFSLVQRGAKFSFYLLLFISLPVLLDTEYILNIWLKKEMVPEHSVNFVRLVLIDTLLNSLGMTFYTVMMATGKIKNYQIITSSLQILILPIVYIILKMGGVPEMTVAVSIIIGHISFFVQLFILNRSVGLSIEYFLKKVYLNVLTVAGLSFILPFLVYYNMDEGFLRLICVGTVSVLSSGICILFVGCNKKERLFLIDKIIVIIRKFMVNKKTTELKIDSE